ncbi:hypothetical protein R3W88_008519 [Solanum pinnatisectum]|uniref:Uncharacterized protein n=1 Tax=Solanum pinnatisectum TaxID=50273 RepID=A0AAV9M888_9SOLN|nr:hypothetical protein R3W88_008519 [Solanum pinnatisectum]
MQAVRVNEEEKPDDTKLSSAAKMVASEILKYRYQLKNGLGPKSNSIIEPIQMNPSLFQPESCTHINKNPRSMVMTYNESTEQGKSDEQDHEKHDESMMPENLPHEIEQVESQKKPNMDETEVFNLGDEGIVKETLVSIHLEVRRK